LIIARPEGCGYINECNAFGIESPKTAEVSGMKMKTYTNREGRMLLHFIARKIFMQLTSHLKFWRNI